MAETAAGSRSCSLSFIKPSSLVCLLVSVPFLVFSCFLGVWFLPFLVTVSVLVLSTVSLVTCTRKKVVLDGNPDPSVQNDELMSCSSKDLPEVEVDAPGSEELLSETETAALHYKATHQGKGNQILHEHAFNSPDIEIEMESVSVDDEDLIRNQNLGLTLVCPNYVDEESTETSGDSISASDDDEDDEYDEDSLIEIALPGEEPKQKLQSNLPADLLSGSFFREDGLLELLEEMNEEDNMIEIDISGYDLYELDVKCKVF